MLNKFFSKKFKVNKTNIFLFSFLLTQIAVPTFELFKPSSANANGIVLGSGASGARSTALGVEASASGFGSTALGVFSTASGSSSTAIGVEASASGIASTALGDEATASGDRSTALGDSANALGPRSSALGDRATASGSGSTALGGFSSASGGGSTALGDSATASGSGSTALGGGATASSGDFSTALGGFSSASGGGSTALGFSSNASHQNSTAVGAFAVTDKDNQIVLGTSINTVTVKGDLVVGVDGEYTLITREGITVNGVPLITEKANGEIHIGKNSLITTNEEKTLPNGKKVQPLYAKDDAGNLIPIDVRTKLLINGRDIEQSINNVGAMTAALTGLPTVPVDTNLACGVGTGTHGGDFAFSGGCASKVNENLSVNYAASMIMPSQDFAGDFEDQFSARAGFVWKLGKSNEPTKISMNQKKEMDLKISKLEIDNEDLKAKNDAIISQNAKLLARLEKLENVAFTLQKNEGLKLSKGL